MIQLVFLVSRLLRTQSGQRKNKTQPFIVSPSPVEEFFLTDLVTE